MALVFFAFLIIALIDLPPLIRKKQRRTLIIYALIFFVALGTSLLYAAGAKLPSPLLSLNQFMKEVLHLSY